MPDLRPVLHVVGLLLSALAAIMIVPAIVDAFDRNSSWVGFVGAAAVTAFFGGALALTNMSRGRFALNVRQGFVLTTASWIAVAAFSALPFLFSGGGTSYADAFFEAISGLTTTGATVFIGLDGMPRGMLLWRSLLQWIGGVGIVVMAILILPFLRIGGMQLFHLESSDRSERVVPRATQLIVYIVVGYLLLSGTCALLYRMAGMSAFDAIAHAMTTLATAGFSTHDASFGYFELPAVHWIAVVFMTIGSLPFVLFIRTARGDRLALVRDAQARIFVLILALSSVALALWLALAMGTASADALRLAFFNVTSIVSTTGFALGDFGLWGTLAVSFFFVLMFIGGCSGSTAGAIKVYRFQILWVLARSQLRLLIDPRRVIVPSFAGRPLPPDVPSAVLAFVTAYFSAVILLALGLSAQGLDFLTSMSAAASAMGNVGPGLGPIVGPAGTYAPLPDAAKWMLSFGMLLGRLELFTVLVLLEPQFWRG